MIQLVTTISSVRKEQRTGILSDVITDAVRASVTLFFLLEFGVP